MARITTENMEPNHWQLGRWAGIPVSMHWTVLIGFAWLYLFFWDLLATAIASVAYFALLVAHEFGHVAALRLKKIAAESIELTGLHGRTAHGWAAPADDIFVAWGGVAAQGVVLVLALLATFLLPLQSLPGLALVTGPILFVFTKLNVFLMVLALLPLGPFDGHRAWALIPWLRKKLRQRRRAASNVTHLPEQKLSPERRRELEAQSTEAASALIDKLSKKTRDSKEDAP
jgi:stage IV sporulation protein FB